MKIDLKKIYSKLIDLIMYYPFIYFATEMIKDFTGIDFTKIYTLIIFFFIVINFKYIQNKILIIFIIFLMIINKILNWDMNSFSMMYRFLSVILIFSFFTNKKSIEMLKDKIKLKYNIFNKLYIINIILLVVYSLMSKGYINKWGSNNYFIGPFDTPHELGYYLLVLLVINMYMQRYLRKTNKIIIPAIIMILQLFTGARVPLITTIILFVIFMSSYYRYKKVNFILAIIIGMLFLVIGFKIEIFQEIPFIQKMIYTTGKDSLSSGRDIIWSGNIMAFQQSFIGNKIFGSGMEFSFYVNSLILNNPIWSHNDFIHILLAYGIVGLLIYLYIIIKMLYKNFNMLIIISILAYMNGLFTYNDFCMMVPFLLIYGGNKDGNIKKNIEKN